MRVARTVFALGVLTIAAAVLSSTAAAKVHPRTIDFVKNGTACDHDVDTRKVKLSIKRDIAIFEATNDGNGKDEDKCGAKRYVTLCVPPNLFNRCVGGGDLNVPFEVADGAIVRLTCTGKTMSDEFELEVLAGPTATQCSERKALRHHVIDIEIVP